LTEHPYVEALWMHTLRTFLRHADSTITTTSICCPSLLRIDDQAIMTAIRRQRFSNKLHAIINECRLWLQLVTIAEKVNTAGTEILPCTLNGATDAENRLLLWLTSRSKLVWPHTTRPNTKAWKTWEKALFQLYTAHTTQRHNPLGRWLHSWNTQRSWLYQASDNCRLIRQNWRTIPSNTLSQDRLQPKRIKCIKSSATPTETYNTTNP
jgi:hypothetical protein